MAYGTKQNIKKRTNKARRQEGKSIINTEYGEHGRIINEFERIYHDYGTDLSSFIRESTKLFASNDRCRPCESVLIDIMQQHISRHRALMVTAKDYEESTRKNAEKSCITKMHSDLLQYLKVL